MTLITSKWRERTSNSPVRHKVSISDISTGQVHQLCVSQRLIYFVWEGKKSRMMKIKYFEGSEIDFNFSLSNFISIFFFLNSRIKLLQIFLFSVKANGIKIKGKYMDEMIGK